MGELGHRCSPAAGLCQGLCDSNRRVIDDASHRAFLAAARRQNATKTKDYNARASRRGRRTLIAHAVLDRHSVSRNKRNFRIERLARPTLARRYSDVKVVLSPILRE